MEKSFTLDESDARILLELDQLYHKLGWTPEKRVQLLQSLLDTVYQRDDLLVEYILLLQQVGKYEDAYNILKNHGFHPWEGGEGRVTGVYKSVLISLSKAKESEGNLVEAEELLKAALIYPENLGEGKLEGTKDNDLHFFLGKLYEKMEEAKGWIEKVLDNNPSHMEAKELYRLFLE